MRPGLDFVLNFYEMNIWGLEKNHYYKKVTYFVFCHYDAIPLINKSNRCLVIKHMGKSVCRFILHEKFNEQEVTL